MCGQRSQLIQSDLGVLLQFFCGWKDPVTLDGTSRLFV